MPKQSHFKVKALADDQATIYIYGDIGYDFWAEESNDAKTLVDKLNDMNVAEITVRINSYGGSVSDGVAIYNALKRHPAKIITVNDGVAMSAASLIFMAGDERHAAANALLMIHAPMDFSWDALNAEEHRERAEMLDKYSDGMVSSYLASNLSREEIESLLKDGNDHYYTAEEALSDGFATEITEAVQIAASGIKTDRFSLPAAWVAANRLNQEEKAMPKKQEPTATNTPAAATDDNVPAKEPVAAAAAPQSVTPEQVLAAEQQRRTDIRAAFTPFKDRDGVQAMLDTVLDNPSVDVTAAREQLLTHLGKNSEPLAGDTHISVGATAGDRFIEGAGLAIMARAGHGQRDRANPFNGASMMDMARAALDVAGVNHRGMDKLEVVGAAFTHSTSDFPNLLEDAMHKLLLASYAAAPDTWSRFCKVGNLSDFRTHNRYRGAAFGNLDDKTENNEFKHKTIQDAAKQTIQLGTKGNIIAISREMIINDDLGFFIDMLNYLGRASKRTVESMVYTYLASNPTMADGTALFHADHGNLAGTGTAVTMAAVQAGRVAMAQQQDISGTEYLDIRPAVWVGGMAYGGDARSVNEAQYDPDTANKLQKPNQVRGVFSDVVDTPRISGNAWYMFADPMEAPVLEVGFLDGNQNPYLEMKEGFTQDGAMYKVRLDTAVAAIAWEGAYKNAGA